jgi:hypothetical protein
MSQCATLDQNHSLADGWPPRLSLRKIKETLVDVSRDPRDVASRWTKHQVYHGSVRLTHVEMHDMHATKTAFSSDWEGYG